MYKIVDFEKKKNRSLIILKVFNICICLIIIPIIIYNITLIIKYIINPREIPDFLGYKSFEIMSRSMEKTINKNDVIIVKEVPEENIEINDIIAFDNNKEIITHRVVKIENIGGQTFYTTKGDNNKLEDKDKISYDQIEGKYIFKISNMGCFIEFLRNRYILTILFIILIFCLIHIVKVKHRRKIRHEKFKVENVRK